MIDPVSALSLCSVAFTGVKKAVQLGQDIEQIYTQLNKWCTAVEDVKEHIFQEETYKTPSIFTKLKPKQSATQEAFSKLIAEKKIKEQEQAIRELFTNNWSNPHMGLDGYKKFISYRREIRRKRQEQVYAQMRKRKQFIYNTKLGILLGIMILSLWFMIDFLWTSIVEASK